MFVGLEGGGAGEGSGGGSELRAFLRPLDHDSPQNKQGDVEK